MPATQFITLRHFNNGLTLAVIGVSLYIAAFPFLPAVSLPVRQHFNNNHGYVYHSQLLRAQPAVSKPLPADNRLVIPALLLDEPIYDGRNIAVINYGGTWRRPITSTPDKSGNTVIIGHRFTYKGASTFYNLDKLRVGNILIVYWRGAEYDYRVTETKIVPPTDTSAETPTADKRLTLYTCTPLWTAKNRLIITALPMSEPTP